MPAASDSIFLHMFVPIPCIKKEENSTARLEPPPKRPMLTILSTQLQKFPKNRRTLDFEEQRATRRSEGGRATRATRPTLSAPPRY